MTSPERSRASRRRPNIPMYLVALVALIGIAESVAYLAEQRRSLERAERFAGEYVESHVSLAGGRISEALVDARTGAEAVAANPGLEALFQPGEPPEGCSLNSAGAGPFEEGHLAVVDAAGSVRCSSLPLPEPGVYADAPWLADAVEVPGVHGPYADPQTGARSLVVTAPVGEQGFVAAFLATETVEPALERAASVDRPVRFELLEPGERLALTDAITRTATVEPLGWTLVAGMDRDVALERARHSNSLLLLGLAASFLVVVAGTTVVYLGLARPIRRLSDAVRGGFDGSAPDPAAVGGPVEVARIAEDFTELRAEVASELERRREAEREAASSREYYRRLFATNPIPMWIYDADDRRILEVNDAAVDLYGYSRHEFTTMTIHQLWPERPDGPAGGDGAGPDPHPGRGAAAPDSARTGARPAQVSSGPGIHQLADGTLIEVDITAHAVDVADLPAFVVMAEDVTSRERSRRLLERAQRMESLGQLAGGIAHDFNNVLAVMLSYAEFAAGELAVAAGEDPDRWRPVLDDVEQIGIAGNRAATLTHQLLAFARGESAEVGPVDLNEVARETEGMLRRTIGEQVELQLALAPDLRPVIANRGQMTQIIVNLAVNSRDAMADGGRLLIETSNVVIGVDELDRRPGLAAGRHVRLRVSDTGSGMDAATREQAFEPLFSTKPRGQGTGLGLATVYGIVSRAGGEVHLYSEPGLGTTVSVLLPAAPSTEETAEARVRGERHGAAATGTILLVEDDDDLRVVTERILVEAGHHVLVAGGGAEALELYASAPHVDLLVTDVVMPEMTGPELAMALAERDPDLRVLFMSGYAPPLLFAGGRLPLGATLVDKPFSASTLTEHVRDSLDGVAGHHRPTEPPDHPS